MEIDYTSLSPGQVYHTMMQSLLPRPIAWVLTENNNDSFNLAPFSYFAAVSSAPPLLMFSVGKKLDGGPKDTITNIEQRKHFVVHIASADQADVLNASSASLAYGESEVDTLGIELERSDFFPLPRVSACPLAFNCELYQLQQIGQTPMTLVFGEIKSAYISDQVINHAYNEKQKLKLSADAINPLARLGGGEFATLGDIFNLKRPA